MKVLESPLDALSRQAQPYPAHKLREGETGLALFSAGFLGINDAIHFARMEMTSTCVDINASKLRKMERMYPDDWTFVVSDAWEFADAAAGRGDVWDVVSVDTFLGDATKRSLESLEVWCALSRRLVTATIPARADYVKPRGWNLSIFPRSDRASWMVLIRA